MFKNGFVLSANLVCILASVVAMSQKSEQTMILLSKHNEGAFIYDLLSAQMKQVIKYESAKDKLDETRITREGNQLKVVVYNIEEKVEGRNGGIYHEREFTINLANFNSYLSKNIRYLVKNSVVVITETYFGENGKIERDVSYENSKVKVKEPSSDPAYFESEVIGGVKVFSKNGDLYLQRQNTVELLLKHKYDLKNRSPKFLHGYVYPCLSSDGNVVFRDANYDNSLKKKTNHPVSYMIALDLKSKKQRQFWVDEDVHNPKLSPDNRSILFVTPFASNKGNYFIYSMDDSSLVNLPTCDYAQWIPQLR